MLCFLSMKNYLRKNRSKWIHLKHSLVVTAVANEPIRHHQESTYWKNQIIILTRIPFHTSRTQDGPKNRQKPPTNCSQLHLRSNSKPFYKIRHWTPCQGARNCLMNRRSKSMHTKWLRTLWDTRSRIIKGWILLCQLPDRKPYNVKVFKHTTNS